MAWVLVFAFLLASRPAESLLLNFRNVEIRQIIESVGELTGKNFLIDPRVRGKVTILANEEVPDEALYDVMLSILRMHGFRAVEGENLTRILPGNIASRFKPEFVDGDILGDSEKLVTTIISVKHLNAASIIPMIKPLMSAQAQVLVHKETNKLLVTEINANLGRVMRIIGKIDVADISDFEIIDLDYADAKDLVGLVQRASNKNLRHLAQVVADKNGNRIILTGPRDVRRSLRALIAELDSETSGDASGRIKVIRLHYARAEDIESIIKGLLSSSEFIKSLGAEDEYVEPKPKAKKKGDKKKGDKAAKEEKKDDKKKTSSSGKRNYVLQVDKALNALIVGGPPKVIAAVEHVVKEIDIPRPQVLIEAIFADITENKRLELGTALGGGDVDVPVDDNPLTGVPSDARGLGVVFSGALVSRSLNIGGQTSISGNAITLIIRALKTDRDSRVLSTPSILTMNNEEATIKVATERSIDTGSSVDDGVTTADFERQEFGTTLKVQPQITEGDAVRLDIEYESKAADASNAGSDEDFRPESRNRNIETTVLVNDGDILMLGGLSTEEGAENRSSVPFLSKIPILGHLFKARSSDRNKTTLMVFIRPTILRNADESGEASRARYAELRLQQLIGTQTIETLMPEEDQMVLPEMPAKAKGERDVENVKKAKKGKKKIIKRKNAKKGKKKIIKRKKRRADDRR